jgi:hypothetical protein
MIEAFCHWLAATPLSQLFQNLSWFVPLVQTVHILSIAVVVFAIGMLDFRLLGLSGAKQPIAALAGYFLPWMWRALLALLLTGTLLTITEPARELLNDSFRVKMLMVLALAGIMRVLQTGLNRDPQFWAASRRRMFASRSIAVASLLLGVGIVAAGRWIAYT